MQAFGKLSNSFDNLMVAAPQSHGVTFRWDACKSAMLPVHPSSTVVFKSYAPHRHLQGAHCSWALGRRGQPLACRRRRLGSGRSWQRRRASGRTGGPACCARTATSRGRSAACAAAPRRASRCVSLRAGSRQDGRELCTRSRQLDLLGKHPRRNSLGMKAKGYGCSTKETGKLRRCTLGQVLLVGVDGGVFGASLLHGGHRQLGAQSQALVAGHLVPAPDAVPAPAQRPWLTTSQIHVLHKRTAVAPWRSSIADVSSLQPQGEARLSERQACLAKHGVLWLQGSCVVRC